MTLSRMAYAQAYDAGETARRNGKRQDDCPRYGYGEDMQTLRERWKQGWGDEDARRLEQVRKAKGK